MAEPGGGEAGGGEEESRGAVAEEDCGEAESRRESHQGRRRK